MHEVREGETLWQIARRYQSRVDEILRLNKMSESDAPKLRPGMTLNVPARQASPQAAAAPKEPSPPLPEVPPEGPAGSHHILRQGETLWDLARLYDKPVDSILEANHLSEEHLRLLRPGRPVLIPGLRKRQALQTQTKPEAKARGVEHRMERGETVWDLANRFQVSVAEIMAANHLGPDEVTKLREGSKVFIPGVLRDKKGLAKREPTPSQKRATGMGQRLGLGTRKAASELLSGRVQPAWLRAAGGRPNRLLGTLRWPVAKGWFTRGFGSGEGGYHLAMDIMGEIGWNVRAAGPGIVGYAGNEVTGYGNMVLVIHPGGWVTMYAHNSVNFVVAGQKVARGAILAEVGSTGISKGPHVHFELIHDGKNCDPGPLFRPAVRYRVVKKNPIKALTWTRPDDRPRSLQCFPRRRFPRSRSVVNESAEDEG